MRKTALALTALIVFAGCPGEVADEDPGTDVGGLPNVISKTLEAGSAPDTASFMLTNGGSCPVSFTTEVVTASGGSWLAVSPSTGTVPAGGQVMVTVTFTVTRLPSSAPDLVPGLYTGTLSFLGTCMTTGRPARGTPAAVGVNLTVTDAIASIEAPSLLSHDAVTLRHRWSVSSGFGAPTPRARHQAFWTGTHMLIFGGEGQSGGSMPTSRDDGGIFDAIAGSWAPMPSASASLGLTNRVVGPAVWNGTELVVCGRDRNIAGFDPRSGMWRLHTSGLSVPQFSHAFAVRDLVHCLTDDLRTLVLDGPSPLTLTLDDPPQAALRSTHWDGRRLLVSVDARVQSPGYILELAAGRWRPFADSEVAISDEPSAVWTGSRFILWGTRRGLFESVGLYDPFRHLWEVRPGPPAPSDRRVAFSTVWTGAQMIVFGGTHPDPTLEYHWNTGYVFDPRAGAPGWTATATTGAPSLRSLHSAVWTGTQMLVWGGVNAGGYVGGAVYAYE